MRQPALGVIAMIGQTISPYRVLQKIGGGGIGVVYKAQDLRASESVAFSRLSWSAATWRAAKREFPERRPRPVPAA
jgi:eukaryotic-like serine/threonine-protein kinase